MKKSVILLSLITICLYSCGQEKQEPPKTEPMGSKRENIPLTLIKDDPNSFIHTENKYQDDEGNELVIQNSYPKGGGEINGIRGYTNKMGIHHGYGVFWSRITNMSDKSVKIDLSFPADSIAIPEDSLSIIPSYYKLFLPPHEMTNEKLNLYNYGITGLRNYLDSNFYEPENSQVSIEPGQEKIVTVVILIRVSDNGRIRTGFIPNENQLQYRVDINPFEEDMLFCGTVAFKE